MAFTKSSRHFSRYPTATGSEPEPKPDRMTHLKVSEITGEANADPTIKGAGWSTPLHVAAEEGHLDVIESLLAHQDSQGNCLIDVNAVDECRSGSRQNAVAGQTPLHLACQHGRYEIARVLLEAGADLLANDGDDCTVLHKACASGVHRSAEIFLECL